MIALSNDVLSRLSQTKTETVISQLKAARIFEVDEGGHYVPNGILVNCMFNPYEYSVSKSNSFSEHKSANGTNSPKAELSQTGPQTLKLNLFFDTTQAESPGERNVALTTNKLWELMSNQTGEINKKKLDPQQKKEVPLVAFQWGVFYFVAYITSMSQQFTLFTADGTPVRAKVDITFTQYIDLDDYPNQNPTSGNGPIQRIWQVTAGDRLDLIAAEVYKDATQWRKIAASNGLVNPLDLRPGQILQIPYH